jgi:hypothetical protein
MTRSTRSSSCEFARRYRGFRSHQGKASGADGDDARCRRRRPPNGRWADLYRDRSQPAAVNPRRRRQDGNVHESRVEADAASGYERRGRPVLPTRPARFARTAQHASRRRRRPRPYPPMSPKRGTSARMAVHPAAQSRGRRSRSSASTECLRKCEPDRPLGRVRRGRRRLSRPCPHPVHDRRPKLSRRSAQSLSRRVPGSECGANDFWAGCWVAQCGNGYVENALVARYVRARSHPRGVTAAVFAGKALCALNAESRCRRQDPRPRRKSPRPWDQAVTKTSCLTPPSCGARGRRGGPCGGGGRSSRPPRRRLSPTPRPR